MKKYISLFALVLLIAVIIVIRNGSENNKIKIGVVGPFTGNPAAFGEFMQNGLDLAMDGLPLDQRQNIEIIKEDDMCIGKNAISAVQKLINVDRVKYVIGPLCNESSIATEKLFEDNKVISLTVGLPSNAIANMGQYHFSFSPEIEYLMKSVSSEMTAKGIKRVAIIHMSSALEDENYKHFVKYFTDAGGIIVDDETVVKGSIDFKDSVLKIKRSSPDALMLIAHTGELNNILKQLSVQGLMSLPKYGIHAAESSVLLQNKDLAEELIYPYPGDRTEIESASKFVSGYKKRFVSDTNPYSANVYDGLNILVQSINKCGYNNVDCVQDSLSKLKEYQGANGNLSVDERGVGTYKEIMLKIVKDGKFEVLSK
jgi:branched-chain amino acid transport system substrate-binding protein